MLYELANLSIHNLLRARSRLFMTAGGVMIGTAAVVLLIALTIGLQTAAEASIGESKSLTQITITSSFRRDSTSPALNMDAITQIAGIANVAAVIPELSLNGFVELRSDNLTGSAQIFGIYPGTLQYLGVTAASGSLTLDDNDAYGAIIGGTVASSFSDRSSKTYSASTVDLTTSSVEMRIYAQGSGSTYKKVPFTVNAVLATGFTQDSAIFFPMQTVMDLTEKITGNKLDPATMTFSRVIVQASSRDTAAEVLNAITALGYNATGAGSSLSELNSFFGTLRVILGAVGGVAMLIAAFGVANTMTMAILERTHEIGLMKAIGATDRAIMTVFLTEAGLVGLLGGATGLVISYGLQTIANQLMSNSSFTFLSVNISQTGSGLIAIPSELAIFAVLLATLIGVVAGTYPALRAARMTTVLALKSD